jgi:Protein of unknown function (DUF2937)
MKPARALLGAGEGLLDRVLCVAGAVFFAQAPEFMQQYLQRLGGHLDEARRQLQQFQRTAESSGLTLDRLITQTGSNSDAAIAKLGGVMTEAVSRVQHLESAQVALEHASLWTRPFVFLKQVDPEIARGTWSFFKPAVPTTAEGLIYAVVGMLLLIGTYHFGIKYPIVRARSRPKPTPAWSKP